MLINCHELKLVAIDAEVHWALAQIESLLTLKYTVIGSRAKENKKRIGIKFAKRCDQGSLDKLKDPCQ